MRFGIITISDRSFNGLRPDKSGPTLIDYVTSKGWSVVKEGILPDEMAQISSILCEWADSGSVDVILTSGGTGFAMRDITPEATRAVVDRLTPGLDEAMRLQSAKFTRHAFLSRAISGILKATLIINLPGSPKAALENLQAISDILHHAVELMQNDPDAEKNH